jgi:catechol 2,3-dioxygenase-like lactoylglutathione lyase family enzyme
MIKGIATIVFKVSDIARSCDFFEKKLGLKIAYREDNWAEVDLNAVHLGLMPSEQAGGARNPFLSLLVDDINATVATLKERGVEFVGDVKDETFGKLITVKDPDGNLFDLFEAAE